MTQVDPRHPRNRTIDNSQGLYFIYLFLLSMFGSQLQNLELLSKCSTLMQCNDF